MTGQRFVILDRDGTIIQDRHYLAEPGGVELCPNAAEGLRRMSAMGLGLVVATNQSGIGRGYFSESRLELIHKRMVSLLAVEGVRLDGIYYCPHLPEEGCSCRKPRTGLLDRAAQELGFSACESIVIGDKPSDIEFGRAAGAMTILVCTGRGDTCAPEAQPRPDRVADDLLDAAEAIRALIGGPEKP